MTTEQRVEESFVRGGRPTAACRGWRVAESPYPMWIFDRRTAALLAANDAAVAAFAGTREALGTVRVGDLFPSSAAGASILDHREQDVLWVGPWLHRRSDGTTAWAEVGLIESASAEGPSTMIFLNRLKREPSGAAGLVS